MIRRTPSAEPRHAVTDALQNLSMKARQPEDRRKGGRAERLAAALKQNLKRRKAQARGRSASDREAPAAAPAEDPKAQQER